MEWVMWRSVTSFSANLTRSLKFWVLSEEPFALFSSPSTSPVPSALYRLCNIRPICRWAANALSFFHIAQAPFETCPLFSVPPMPHYAIKHLFCILAPPPHTREAFSLWSHETLRASPVRVCAREVVKLARSWNGKIPNWSGKNCVLTKLTSQLSTEPATRRSRKTWSVCNSEWKLYITYTSIHSNIHRRRRKFLRIFPTFLQGISALLEASDGNFLLHFGGLLKASCETLSRVLFFWVKKEKQKKIF